MAVSSRDAPAGRRRPPHPCARGAVEQPRHLAELRQLGQAEPGAYLDQAGCAATSPEARAALPAHDCGDAAGGSGTGSGGQRGRGGAQRGDARRATVAHRRAVAGGRRSRSPRYGVHGAPGVTQGAPRAAVRRFLASRQAGRAWPRQRQTARHDRALHVAGDGPDLERGAQVRPLVPGRDAGAGGARRRRPGARRRGGGRAGRPAAHARRPSPRSRRPPSTTSSPSSAPGPTTPRRARPRRTCTSA